MFTAVLLLGTFDRLGSLLVVADPLEKADAIVVFGGGLPVRGMEAAKIYSAGWAPEVWLTKGDNPEGRILDKMGIGFLPEHVYSRRLLEKSGVPGEAIRTLGSVVNTTEEVRLVLATLSTTGKRRVILVSSKSHTRRIRLTWQALATDEVKAVVRYATEDPYQSDRWWANSRDVLAVTREIGGILNVWAGSPLKAARE